jgi:CheY-like chemotaxis protein
MSLIMIVDDYPDACDLLARLLQRLGHRVSCAHSGPEALQILGSVLPDVVLLDHMMPGMSGIEVLRAMRADRRFVATPVVLFTAMCDDKTRADAASAGATDFWTKPIDAQQFEPALARVLQHVSS